MEIGQNDKERKQKYQRLILDKEKGINSTTFNQLFLGTKEFIKQMEDRFKVNNIRLQRGRPKKVK